MHQLTNRISKLQKQKRISTLFITGLPRFVQIIFPNFVGIYGTPSIQKKKYSNYMIRTSQICLILIKFIVNKIII